MTQPLRIHVMLDLETLSTRSDAAIVQIGAVPFHLGGVWEPKGHPLACKYFNAFALPGKGAHIDPATIGWWLSQKEEAQGPLSKALQDPKTWTEARVLAEFSDWFRRVSELNKDGFTPIWSNGATFDIPILASAFERNDMAIPWDFQAARCYRTIMTMSTDKNFRPPDEGLIAHEAASDCIWQIRMLRNALYNGLARDSEIRQ